VAQFTSPYVRTISSDGDLKPLNRARANISRHFESGLIGVTDADEVIAGLIGTDGNALQLTEWVVGKNP
jgi:hypothetical protein